MTKPGFADDTKTAAQPERLGIVSTALSKFISIISSLRIVRHALVAGDPASLISETGKGDRSKRPPLSETSLQVPMPVVSPFVGFVLPFFAIALILLTEKGVSALRVSNLRCIVLWSHDLQKLCNCKNRVGACRKSVRCSI